MSRATQKKPMESTPAKAASTGALPDSAGKPPRSEPAMAGLRERNKQARHDAIVDAAMQLFQRKGYEQTTMEEIAAEADISAPTLYRYFPRKPELLIALFWLGRARMSPKLEAFHRASVGMGAVEAVSGLLFLNNSGVETMGERKLWREAMAAQLRMHDLPDDEFRRIKQYFEEHIERMLLRLRADGKINPDAPIKPMLDVLYAIAAENYYRILANEFPSADDERSAMDAQVGMVMQGWVKGR